VFRADLTTLRLFLAVYNMGNISKAAEHEHIAPSAISKRIQAFEAELGIQLFYRLARGVSPTPAAKNLARHARTVFADLNRMAADLSGYANGQYGEVRIHAHSSAVIQYLPDDLARFLEGHPQVEIVLREKVSVDVLQSLVDGAADIGICDSNVPMPPGLMAYPYKSDTLVALCPASHALARHNSIRFADIRDSDHVSLETGSSIQMLVARAAESHGFELNTRIEVRTFEAAVRMVEHGIGVAVLPTNIIRLHANAEKVRLVSLEEDWAIRRLLLCIKGPEYLTPPARLMFEQLRAPEQHAS
jgi:DNA-binding transcriptional LysR family regulator